MTSYDAQIVVAGNGSTTASTFYPVAGDLTSGFSATESNTQFTVRDSGTFKNLFVNIDVNTDNGTCVIQTRKNAVNGNQSVSIGASTSGNFEDTVNTDSVISGDKVNYSLTYGGTSGSIIPTVLSQLYTSSSTVNTTTFLFDSSLTAYSTAGSYYSGLNSVASGNTTESNAALFPEITTSVTIQNLFVNVTANTDSVNTHIVSSRKNSAAGTMSVSIGTSVTGILEDTTHSDTLTLSTDTIDLLFDATSISGSVTLNIGVTMINANRTFLMCGSDPHGFTGAINFNLTRSFPVSGSPLKQATESTIQMKVRNTNFEVKNLTYNISANTLDGASTLALRKNGANVTNNSASIAANTTGAFFLNGAIDTLASTDLIDYQLVTTTSTTGSITLTDVHISGLRQAVANTYSITESRSITGTLSRKVIPKVSEPSHSIVGTVSIKVIRKTLLESPSFSSTLSRKSIPKIIEPSLSISDSVTRIKGHFYTIHESRSITGTLSIKVIRKTLLESPSFSSTLSRKVKPVITNSIITASQSVSVIQTLIFQSKSITESIPVISDSVSRNVSVHMTITEAPFYPNKDKVDSTYIEHRTRYLFKFGSRYKRF